MDEPNEFEIAAMGQAGDAAGAYIDTVGRTDMATYTPEEWSGFIAAVCGAYVDALMQQQIDANTALSEAQRMQHD